MKRRFGVAASGLVLIFSSMAVGQISLPPSGIIRTIAGNGTQGYSGDGGPATSASMSWVLGIASDSDGNLYVADTGNFRVREVIASTGEIVTIAGNGASEISGDHGPATQAGLGSPVAVAIDAAKNIYVLNATSVRKVSASDGTISTVVGGSTSGFSGDGGPASLAQFDGATGLAVDAIGNLYIADSANNRVRKVTASTGIIETIAGTGQAGFSGDGGPANEAELNRPDSIAVDVYGNVYIADYSNCRVRKVSVSSGQINTIAGTDNCGFSGDGGVAINAAIGEVLGVAVDSQGNVYLADNGNNRVRMIDAAHGVISTIAGDGVLGILGDNGPAISAELETIYGLAVDQSGYLYVLNSALGVVRAIGPGAAQNPTAYTVTLGSSDPTPQMGESIVLKANVTSNLGLPAISGTVTWYLGSNKLGQTNVDGDGLATFVTLIPSAGDQTIAATYDGTPFGSGSFTLPVSGFALSGLANSSIRIASGQNAQIVVNAAAFHGFVGTVDLTCSGLPYPGLCAMSPGSVTFTKNMTAQAVTVSLETTTGVTTTPAHTKISRTLAFISVGSFVLVGLRPRRPLRSLFLFIPLSLVLSVTLALSGCGSNSLKPEANTGSSSKLLALPAGTYNVVLTASAGNDSAELPITVTVQ